MAADIVHYKSKEKEAVSIGHCHHTPLSSQEQIHMRPNPVVTLTYKKNDSHHHTIYFTNTINTMKLKSHTHTHTSHVQFMTQTNV